MLKIEKKPTATPPQKREEFGNLPASVSSDPEFVSLDEESELLELDLERRPLPMGSYLPLPFAIETLTRSPPIRVPSKQRTESSASFESSNSTKAKPAEFQFGKFIN